MITIIVSDTTSLIVLEKLQRFDLLCLLFERVLVPEVVLEEIKAGSPEVGLMLQNQKCIEIVSSIKSKRLTSLLTLLDEGEAHAIALAADRWLPLIIDERKGRKVARQLGITVTGFAGLIILAKRMSVLDEAAAVALLEQAMCNGLRLSDKLLAQVRLTLVGN